MLAVLSLFTISQPERTIDAAAEKLGVSTTTAYRYFKQLTKAGLVSPVSGASYTLGPAIIAMDRQIQLTDPMLGAARTVMADLVQYAANGSAVLLCRLFHDGVMCVHQVMGRGPQLPVSYERGRVMQLYRGATSRIILAHLSTRTLKSLYARDYREIAAAGLGETWNEFRRALTEMRRRACCISKSEIDPGRIGIAAPICDSQSNILGSLSFVLPAQLDDRMVARLMPLTIAGAREIESAMIQSTSMRLSRARIKVARDVYASALVEDI